MKNSKARVSSVRVGTCYQHTMIEGRDDRFTVSVSEFEGRRSLLIRTRDGLGQLTLSSRELTSLLRVLERHGLVKRTSRKGAHR